MPAQEGFILIEVLVSALILAIVAGAVLTLITATTRSAASQRTHSVAYSLAQEDQARLRTMQIQKLKDLNGAGAEERKEEVGDATYTVKSEGIFVNNNSQAASCSKGNDSSDYIQLTSTVTGPGLVNPVSVQSVVSPTNGSLDPSVGTLGVIVTNAASEPLSGVSLELSGSAAKVTSQANGCANFADVTAGTHTLTSFGNGLINPEGKPSATQPATVAAGDSLHTTVSYDKGGSLQPEFVVLNSTTGKLETAAVDSMRVYNSSAGKSTATTWGTPTGQRLPNATNPYPLKAAPLYPFHKSKYTVFAGSCESNNPDPSENTPANDIAMGFVEVPPGGTVAPQIRLPALNLGVTYKGKAVEGATVTLTDTACKSENGEYIKRLYTTNEQGHLAAEAKGATEAGLPWGTYKICVSANLENLYRKNEKYVSQPVTVKNLTSGTTVEVSLSSSEVKTSESSSNKC